MTDGVARELEQAEARLGSAEAYVLDRTPEQLAEIRARAEAATPGPWVVVPEYEAGYSWVETTAGGGLPVTAIDNNRPHDQQFVAHARSDIPALLDYIEELQAKIAPVKSNTELAELYERAPWD